MLFAKLLMIVITANFPSHFVYEGRLYDAKGNIYQGEAEFIIRLYDLPEGGTPIWEEGRLVDVKDGFFSIEMGKKVALPEPLPLPLWLGVEVNSAGEMSPRLEIGTVPFSMVSKTSLSTKRKILHKALTQQIILNTCTSDPSTCCHGGNPTYWTLDGASLTGVVGGNLLLSFSTSIQAASSTPAGEQRGYQFGIFLDGNLIYATHRACVASVPWEQCTVAITYLLPNLQEGEHNFEVKYCAFNPDVTGSTKVWNYNFEVIEMP